MYTLSFLSGFMYVISRRSKKVRSHSFSSSDKTICFLPRVSASFTRVWYRLPIHWLLPFSYVGWLTGNPFSARLMLHDNACFVEKDFGVLLAGYCWFSWRCSSPTFLLLTSPSFFLWRYNSLSSFFLISYFSRCFTWNRVKVLHTSTKLLFSHWSIIKPLFRSIKFDWEYDLETLN